MVYEFNQGKGCRFGLIKGDSSSGKNVFSQELKNTSGWKLLIWEEYTRRVNKIMTLIFQCAVPTTFLYHTAGFFMSSFLGGWVKGDLYVQYKEQVVSGTGVKGGLCLIRIYIGIHGQITANVELSMDGTLAFLRIELGTHFWYSINLISFKGDVIWWSFIWILHF